MNSTRKYFFLFSALGFFIFLIPGILTLLPFGQNQSEYARIVLTQESAKIKATNIVTAVAFDYRGFDSFIEAIILFTSVVGIILVLRVGKKERKEISKHINSKKQPPKISPAIEFFGLVFIGYIAFFGFYMVLHAPLSPGGGFQGGVIISSALLLIYLAGSYFEFIQRLSLYVISLVESLGLISLILLGSIPFLEGNNFFYNFLPKGTLGNILSSGTILPFNLFVGITVMASIIQILNEFLEQVVIIRKKSKER
ncbi:MnhB domain-containing protein [Legionella cincinnatiensis]|uniref:Monovalent cation/H+ antiporter subunit B n=1 Tax=Legionella cincinnatiensis TaxID=28085 RepID=A0A378IHJ5_9GAMM|nr:MnhB domain-containing protein [Legionella cincinnatiensis]KTC92628.1 putative monovalent cation/H+ antiporter subunit B [Legionella cincinnatiensis]STX34242.1 putative monovalent cation/H+ antiporter subunit B [Legionella cincinnatiensis]